MPVVPLIGLLILRTWWFILKILILGIYMKRIPNVEKSFIIFVNLTTYLRISAIFNWPILKSTNFLLLVPFCMEFKMPLECILIDNFMECNKSYGVQLSQCWDSIFKNMCDKKQLYILIKNLLFGLEISAYDISIDIVLKWLMFMNTNFICLTFSSTFK